MLKNGEELSEAESKSFGSLDLADLTSLAQRVFYDVAVVIVELSK